MIKGFRLGSCHVHGRIRSHLEACRGRSGLIPEQDLSSQIPLPICSGASTTSGLPGAPSASPMERDVRLSHSKRICLSCNRILPKAAARCPWCITSTVVPAALADEPDPNRLPTAHPSRMGARLRPSS